MTITVVLDRIAVRFAQEKDASKIARFINYMLGVVNMIKEPLPDLRCLCGSRLVAGISPNGEHIEIRPCEQCIRNAKEVTVREEREG